MSISHRSADLYRVFLALQRDVDEALEPPILSEAEFTERLCGLTAEELADFENSLSGRSEAAGPVPSDEIRQTVEEFLRAQSVTSQSEPETP